VRHNERSAAQLKGDAPPGERAARCLNRVTQEETQEVTPSEDCLEQSYLGGDPQVTRLQTVLNCASFLAAHQGAG
jgi:hypothetical protein